MSRRGLVALTWTLLALAPLWLAAARAWWAAWGKANTAREFIADARKEVP